MKSQSEYVIPFENCSSDLVGSVGGKNANLGALTRIGVPVPRGFAVTTRAYKEFIVRNGFDEEIHSMFGGINSHDDVEVAKASELARSMIRSGLMMPELIGELQHYYRELGKATAGKVPVAVRSSATEEDILDASFAGQHDSYLWVRGEENMLKRVRDCWSSLFTQRAVSYRIKNRINLVDATIGVGVQEMVNAKSAGVIFTLNPKSGDRSKIVMESTWGLGEALVSGEVTPDRFVVDKITLEINERDVRNKVHERVVDDLTGTRQQKVEESLQSKASLSDEEVVELAKMAIRIEKHYGRPQDIEFVIDKNRGFPDNLFIVQARPETTWKSVGEKRREDAVSVMDQILDNLNRGSTV